MAFSGDADKTATCSLVRDARSVLHGAKVSIESLI
jgi:hypothetical protein